MRILLAGAAALALASAGAYAEPGKDRGHENSGLKKAADKPDRGKGDRAPARANPRAEQSRQNRAIKPEARPSSSRNKGPQRFHEDERRITRTSAPQGVPSHEMRSHGAELHSNIATTKDLRDRSFLDRDRSRGLIEGCPPGLGRKGNLCGPPGQKAKRSPRKASWRGYDYRPRLFGLTNYAAGEYCYADGYLLRPSADGGIAGYIPLLGGALTVGNAWPEAYASYVVPDYYVDYFDLGRAQSYRFADNVIYRVEPGNATIASVAALLAGDDFVIGEAMPAGYDIYNVPYSFRDRYADSDEAWYRYSDGYVYRIDPRTRLVAAAIDLLI